MKITIVGSGNVAWNLAFALDEYGHTIEQIVSPNTEHAKELAKHFGAYYGSHLSQYYADSEVVIVTIKDDAYESWASKIQLEENVVLCHTSGPVPMDVLKDSAAHYGVLYPLQSFNKERLKRFNDIPVLIEGSDSKTEKTLGLLAKDLSNNVRYVNSQERKKYHLAAVFANNFVNGMYLSAAKYLEAEGLDFEVLKPIIFETAIKMKDNHPSQVQTGPAKRKDLKVLEEHKEMIKDPVLRKLYEDMSAWIMSVS